MTFRTTLTRGTALACAALLAVSGCSSSLSSSKDSSASVADSSSATDVADPPATTNAPPLDAVAGADGSVNISVTVGTDDFDTSGGTRVVGIKKGANVTIELTDPAVAQKYHLHEYEIELDAEKGGTAKMTFTATKTGQIDLESHVTNKVILVLFVS